MAAVVPVAMMVASYIASRRAQKKAAERSAEEQKALAQQQQSAQNLGQTGQQLTGQGVPLQTQAANYYQTLLRGSRPAQAQALAGPIASITDTYRGAERGLEHSGLQGAGKDVAAADLNRQRASQIAGLTTGVQPAAAGALAGLGGQMTGQGIGAQGTSGAMFGDLLREGARNRMYAREQGQQAGETWGQLAGTVAGMYGGGMFGGGGGSQAPLPEGWQGPMQPESGWRSWLKGGRSVPLDGDLGHSPADWRYGMTSY